MQYYLCKRGFIGIESQTSENIATIIASCPIDGLKVEDFEQVSADHYLNSALDLRFEDGVWQQ